MAYLDRSLNQNAKWQEILRLNQRRIEVDLEEVERVLDLARRTPGLSTYEKELHQLSVFFAVATDHYREEAPDELSGLVAFWERYRAVVIQRYTVSRQWSFELRTRSYTTPSTASLRQSRTSEMRMPLMHDHWSTEERAA